MNLANKLTVFRMILVPIMVIIPFFEIEGKFLEIPYQYIIIDFIFIIASLTDKLDGYIARSRNQITTFGKFLDPLADKILVLSAMVMLVEIQKIPSWIPIIVLTREFVVSGYRLIAVQKKGEVIAASFWGKLKTATQMMAIIGIFIDRYSFFGFIRFMDFSNLKVLLYNISNVEIAFNILTSILLTISIIATIFSGIDYLKNGKELFKD